MPSITDAKRECTRKKHNTKPPVKAKKRSKLSTTASAPTISVITDRRNAPEYYGRDHRGYPERWSPPPEKYIQQRQALIVYGKTKHSDTSRNPPYHNWNSGSYQLPPPKKPLSAMDPLVASPPGPPPTPISPWNVLPWPRAPGKEMDTWESAPKSNQILHKVEIPAQLEPIHRTSNDTTAVKLKMKTKSNPTTAANTKSSAAAKHNPALAAKPCLTATTKPNPTVVSIQGKTLAVKSNPSVYTTQHATQAAAKQRPKTTTKQEPVAITKQNPATEVKQYPVAIIVQNSATAVKQEPVAITKKNHAAAVKQYPVAIIVQNSATAVKQEPVAITKQNPATEVKQYPVAIIVQNSATAVKQEPVAITKKNHATAVKQGPVAMIKQNPATAIKSNLTPVVISSELLPPLRRPKLEPRCFLPRAQRPESDKKYMGADKDKVDIKQDNNGTSDTKRNKSNWLPSQGCQSRQ